MPAVSPGEHCAGDESTHSGRAARVQRLSPCLSFIREYIPYTLFSASYYFYHSYFPLKVVIILYSCFSHYQLMGSFHAGWL